jgi:uncharacterized protein with HEPN domain
MNDPYRRLADILARCDEAAELVARGRRAFEADVLLRHAAKSIIADIGEAAKNLGPLTADMGEVPWSQIIRMRDRVSHRYVDVSFDVVWDTLAFDVPGLASIVTAYLEDRPCASVALVAHPSLWPRPGTSPGV